MNYKIIILFILIGSSLISTTLAVSSGTRFDDNNKTLVIKNPLKNNDLLKIEQVSFKPDLVAMEEVFKITSYENYTFNNTKDFNIRWQKYNGKNNITKAKWEILEIVGYNVTLPDFELIEKKQEIPNILSYTNVTEIYDLNPWLLEWGVNSKEKWEIITSEGKGTVGFDRFEITSTYQLNITFFWYEQEQTGSHQVIRYRDEWRPFSPAGKTIKGNESITVKLTFSKKADTGRNSIKTIPRFAGVEEERLTWWNASWDYRIDNPISNGTRPYQLSLILSNATGSNNNATHVFLNGHSNINFTDVRFTLDNTTPLSYWIEKDTGKVWVNVTANGTVNLYYGNPSATETSDGKKTFEFFDDFEPESWQKLQKLPKPHADQAGAVLNGKIYTIGGYDTAYTQPAALVWEYDPVTNSYRQRANLTFARWGPVCTGYGGNIYCFGGLPNYVTEKYNPGTDTWVTLTNPPVPLQNQGLTAVVGGAYIYLFRGGNLYKYNPIADSYINLTLLGGATPNNVNNWPSMAFYNNEIYILCGNYLDNGINYVQIYNLTNNVWRNGAPMPIGLYGTLRENPIINNKIYILQGQGIWNNFDFYSRYWVYNIITNSWDWGELGYWDADGVSGGVIDNKIYTFGGRRGHGTDDRGTTFAGVLDTSKNIQSKWIDVKMGAWREDNSTLTNGLGQRYPTVQIRTAEQVVNTNNKVISRMKYSSGSSGYGGLIIQSNGGVYGSNNNGYLDPFVNITANRDELRKQTGSSSNSLLGIRSLGSPDVWHTYISYYNSSSIRSTRDGANNIVVSDGTYRGGYIQVMKSIGFDLLIDYIAVARYATNEPSWAIWSQEPPNSNTNITSWGNTKTNNKSLTLTINSSEAVKFNATANQTIILWNWFKDDLNQNNNFNNFTTSWSTGGIKTIKVTATSSNGTSNIITWNINVASPTKIFFIDPTPANGATLSKNYAFINTTVSNVSTAFIEWNRSLVGWWRFNDESGENSEFFRDWSSWGNNGACSGVNCPSFTSGKFGNALDFDGSNDYVTVPNSAILNPSNITLEVWFNANSGGLAGQKSLIQKPYTSRAAPYYQYMLSLADTGGSPKSADFYLTVDGVMRYVEIKNLSYNYGQWHYLAGTYDGSTMKMYLDGNIVGTTPIVGTISSYDTILEFGAYPNVAPSSSNVFNGKLDEARIHSRALSPEEIKASYNAGIYRLYMNFTGLTGGSYNYRAYAQNLAGIVNQTETRTLNLNVIATPSISFINPTPANGATVNQNFAFINTTVSDPATAFIDWNRSLIGWWRFNGESGENPSFFRDWSSWGNNAACSGINCPTSTP